MIAKPPMLTRLWQWTGGAPYYASLNNPIAVVLHIAVGWRSTAEMWARSGYTGASWHYFVCLDGTILWQLPHEHGGFQAGILQYRSAGVPNPKPTWPLWRGWGSNVNLYTIGIEHEGFGPFTPEQAAASRWLCKWLAQELQIPYVRERFPAHADIALIDRPNDYGIRFDREAHYRFMFEEEEDELKASERGLLLVASGDFNNMTIAYTALDARGFFKHLNEQDGIAAPIDGKDDLNDAIVRRFRIQWLALSDAADAAWAFINGG